MLREFRGNPWRFWIWQLFFWPLRFIPSTEPERGRAPAEVIVMKTKRNPK